MPHQQEKPLPEALLQNSGLWRASSIRNGFKAGIATGFRILDPYLPGGGWPTDGVTELLHEQYGIGELRLLAPALAHLSRHQARWLLWVAPPYIPYPPALSAAGIDPASILIVRPRTQRDTLWVLEKALASGSCSAVLTWPGRIHSKQIRRLQVAGKKGNCWTILFRPLHAIEEASPAELRIRLSPARTSRPHSSLNLQILKRRGGWATRTIPVSFADRLNQAFPRFSERLPDLPANRKTVLPWYRPVSGDRTGNRSGVRGGFKRF